MTRNGISASPVNLDEAGIHPVIGRRVWTHGRAPQPDPDVTRTYRWTGTVTLTHTASGD